MRPILPLSRDPRATTRFGVVVLAAGASRRLGRPKALVRQVGHSLVRHPVEQARAAGAAAGQSALNAAAPRALASAPARQARAAHNDGVTTDSATFPSNARVALCRSHGDRSAHPSRRRDNAWGLPHAAHDWDTTDALRRLNAPGPTVRSRPR